MSILGENICVDVEDSIADVLEGLASSRLIDHIAECDRCRDFKYEAEQAANAMESAGADFQPTSGFADRMVGLVLEARPDGPMPSMATSSVVPRVSGTQSISGRADGAPESGAASVDAEQAARSVEMIVSAPTEFAAPPDGALRDNNATIIQPSPTFAGEPAEEAGKLAAPTLINDPFVPTHKTMPLSAMLARADATPVPGTELAPALTDGRIVEATTGRNNTGPAGQNLDTSPSPARPTAVGPTLDIPSPAAGPTATGSSASVVPVRAFGGASTSAAAQAGDRRNVVSLFRRKGFIAALAGGMAAAAAIGGFLIHGHTTDQPEVASPDGAWSGSVAHVARASADGGSGFEVCNESCQPALAGAKIEPGSTLKTDSKTRARVKLSDETWIALDRNSEVVLPAGTTRQARLVKGLIVADVQNVEGAQPAKIMLPQGEIEILGTKLAVTVTERRASVEVVRGEVKVSSAGGSAKVRAGEEATLADQGEPIIASASTMSDVLEWSSESSDDVDAPALKGLGELRAKKPGTQQERVGAVRLTKHSVKVRVVDVVARTEVDETFTNSTDEELEGIFRFPLPPDAQIEKLALEVDGKLLEGAFVDRDQGAAIWRGVIQNAAPKTPKPKEEIIWVAGPWRDPALLEWQRGGRFELKIFPIPKKGSRRVVLTYTQPVPQSGGVRRFTYPLAHDSSGSTRIDDFNVDLQVLGHDAAYGVETRGYQLAKTDGGAGAEKLALSEKNFVPAGDLSVEYALANRNSPLTAWAYDMPASATTGSSAPTGALPAAGKSIDNTQKGTLALTSAERAKQGAQEAKAYVEDRSPYVAFAVRPKLPRFPEGKERLHVIVVDSSRSMVGERFARATRLAAGLVREMDRRDQFMVLACDTTCQPMGASEGRTLPLPSEPSAEAAQQVESFLGSIEPDGGSNLLTAMQAARAAAGSLSQRELRILYLGDGTPTVGPTKAATVEAGVRHALPAGDGSVIAVALGADADTVSLGALARGGNGVVVPYVPGQRVNAAAVDVLAAAYGSVLSDVEVVLPAGLTEVTPRRVDPIPAGGETFILARMTNGKQVEGNVILRGRVGSERFEQTYPTKVVASSNAGNAFVPRLFAAAKIEELEEAGGADDRERIVALSKQFNVASRHTSLLVLESEAMFKAFGLEKNGISTVFTGEDRADSSSAATDEAEEAERAPDLAGFDGDGERDDFSRDKSKKETKSAAGPRPAAEEPAFRSAPDRPLASATAKPPAAPPAPPKDAAPSGGGRSSNDPFGDPFSPGWQGGAKRPVVVPQSRPANMIPMRKVFDRKASFSTDKLLATEVAKSLVDAEAAHKATPDSRDKTLALYKALMASGRVGEALELTARWSQRDALDPEALIARADLAAMNGDRERALRILSGLADVRPGDKGVQKRLAAAFTQMNAPAAACQHRIALADLDASDVASTAAAVRCSQDQGFGNLAQAVLAGAPSTLRDKIETTARGLKPNDLPALTGDVRVTASWNAPVDLDIALVDKNGKRLSWIGSTLQNVSVTSKDASSTSTETLSLLGLSSGNFMVEVVRAKGDRSSAPVTGELTFTLPGGESRKVPFTVNGQRADAGSLRVFFTSRLVPVNGGGGRGGWR